MYDKLEITRCECGKEIAYKDAYRCRICKAYFCDKCSLNHYGLYEEGDEVKYKNIFSTMLWLIRKRIFGR